MIEDDALRQGWATFFGLCAEIS